MEKVCANWPQAAFDETLVSGKYWDEFAENAKAAATELIRVGTLQEAEQLLQELVQDMEAKEILAVGGEENPRLGMMYKHLQTDGRVVYTDKFAIAEHAPQADLGISTAEFGIGESGSVCVDTASYESRVTGMLPPTHIVFMQADHMVKNIDTAFRVIAKVYKKGYMGFITGPSRTADIERVLSLGVHGPGRFIVIAVDEPFEGRA